MNLELKYFENNEAIALHNEFITKGMEDNAAWDKVKEIDCILPELNHLTAREAIALHDGYVARGMDDDTWNLVKEVDCNLAEFEFEEVNGNDDAIDIAIQFARLWGRAEAKGTYDKINKYPSEGNLDFEILERWCQICLSNPIGNTEEFFDIIVESLDPAISALEVC